MSSFLFEKQQIDCACFESKPYNVRRVFKSGSDCFSDIGPKSNNKTSVKYLPSKTKLKKKSLKKEKPIQPLVSQNNHEKQEEIDQEHLSLFIQAQNPQNKYRLAKFEFLQTEKYQGLKTQRSRAVKRLRIADFPIPFLSEPFIQPSQPKYHHHTYSQHLITPIYNEEFEQLVQKKFKKDLEEFILEMEKKESAQKAQDKKLKEPQQKLTKQKEIEPFKIRERDLKSSIKTKSYQLSVKQLNDFQQNFTHQNQPRKQFFSNKKHPLDRMATSFQFISEQKMIQKSLHDLKEPQSFRQRKQSFSSSTILHKQKEFHAKKFKNKMYAKQIESEKDGSSENESDKESEVVGRGWDGLTEQKIELEELEEMMAHKGSNHSQTMITEQSHIKTSEIKTFTDYSASFISPKSQQTRVLQNSTAFGGGKYRPTGISYQNIEDLQKVRSSLHGKLHF